MAKDKKDKPKTGFDPANYFGGMIGSAVKKLKGRGAQLKCQEQGLGYDSSTGKCFSKKKK